MIVKTMENSAFFEKFLTKIFVRTRKILEKSWHGEQDFLH